MFLVLMHEVSPIFNQEILELLRLGGSFRH